MRPPSRQNLDFADGASLLNSLRVIRSFGANSDALMPGLVADADGADPVRADAVRAFAAGVVVEVTVDADGVEVEALASASSFLSFSIWLSRSSTIARNCD